MRAGTHTKLLWQECPNLACRFGAALMSEDGRRLWCWCESRRRDGTGHGEHGKRS